MSSQAAPEAPFEVASDSPDGEDPSGYRIVTARQFAGAAACLLLLLLAYLWKPLTSPGYYAPTDVLQVLAPALRTAPDDYRVKNLVLSDPVKQMHPWLKWNRQQLGNGDLPVWNPYNGSGVPHLGNYVSAVFSPFSVPFYVLPFRLALVAAAGFKLFALGIFAYLFLRRVRLSHLPAVLGSVVFTFCGYNLLWSSWPHAGAAICVPAGLYFVELAVQAPDRRRARAALVGYAVAVAVGLLAGHPETLFFSVMAVVAYVALRLAFAGGPVVERLRTALEWGVANVCALGLAAVQLLPFLDYLWRSSAYANRASQYLHSYDEMHGPLHVFPNLYGSPIGEYRGLTETLDYQDASSGYIGLLALFLAGVGLLWVIRRRSFVGLFCAGLGTLWVLYAYDLLAVGRVLGSLPVARHSHVGFTKVWLYFPVSVLAAFGVDALGSLAPLARRFRVRASAAVVGGGLILAGGAVLAARFEVHRMGVSAAGALRTAAAQAAMRRHVGFVVVTFLVGVGAAALVVMSRHRTWAARAAWSTVILALFAQSGFLLRDYNPTIDAEYFYPASQATAVRATVGDEQTFIEELLPADVNLWHEISNPVSYDGSGVRTYETLASYVTRLQDEGRAERAFRALGIRYLVTKQPFPYSVPATDPLLAHSSDGQPLLLEDTVARQTFRATAPGLSAIHLPASPSPPGGPCALTLTLEEADTRRVVAGDEVDCFESEATFRFPPLADSANKEYLATFTGRGSLTVDGAPTDAGLETGGRRAQGHVVLTGLAVGRPALEPVTSFGALTVFRVPGVPPRYYSPPASRVVRADAEALTAMAQPGYDPAQMVLVAGGEDDPGAGGADAPGPSSTAGTVEVLERTPTRVRLRVVRDGPGWVVGRQTFFPGWKATVNGRKAPLKRADVAFVAVPVGPGTSEVTLRYAPASVRWGVLLSALFGLFLAGLLGITLAVPKWTFRFVARKR